MADAPAAWRCGKSSMPSCTWSWAASSGACCPASCAATPVPQAAVARLLLLLRRHPQRHLHEAGDAARLVGERHRDHLSHRPQLHLGVAALLVYLPEPKAPPPKEPVFVDLQNIPELKRPPAAQQETKRLSDQRVRVEREATPRGTDTRDSAPKGSTAQAPSRARSSAPSSAEPGAAPLQPGSSVASLLKPKRQTAQQQSGKQLFPGADRMARPDSARAA